MTAQEATAEYRREAQTLRLAPGWRWPTDVQIAVQGSENTSQHYQVGFGAGRADLYWFISWASTAVSQHLPGNVRRQALAELSALYATTLFREDLSDPSFYTEMITKAQSGDLSRLREFVLANSRVQQ